MNANLGSGDLLAGRYRLVDELGRGGMGVVWRATDEVLRRDVAVKEVKAPAGLEEDQVRQLYARLEQEGRAAARVDHPNVITVFDVASEDGRPWIVMELVRGVSLADALAADGPLPPRRAADVGSKVLAALRVAHAAGVLHRDVKPGNVLIANDGRVVLTDFGIAVIEGSSAITRTGELVGSPEFLAPERALGRSPGAASDLWSLGVTLYAAVEGRSPFRRTTALTTLQAVVDEAPPPSARAGALAPVIEGLLRKDPGERLSGEQAQRSLDEIAAGGEGRPPAGGAFGPAPTMAADPSGYGTGTPAAAPVGAPVGPATGTFTGTPSGATAGVQAGTPVGVGAGTGGGTTGPLPGAAQPPTQAHPQTHPQPGGQSGGGPDVTVIGHRADGGARPGGGGRPEDGGRRRGPGRGRVLLVAAIVVAALAGGSIAFASLGDERGGGGSAKGGGDRSSSAGITGGAGNSTAPTADESSTDSQGEDGGRTGGTGEGEDGGTKYGTTTGGNGTTGNNGGGNHNQHITVTVHAQAVRDHYAGTCPPPVGHAPYFTASIQVSGTPATVKYRWLTGSGGGSGWLTLEFAAGGPASKTVEHTEAPAASVTDWIAVDVSSPQAVQSAHVQFTVECHTDGGTDSGTTEGTGATEGAGTTEGTGAAAGGAAGRTPVEGGTTETSPDAATTET